MHSGKLSDSYKGVRSTSNIYTTHQIQLVIEFVIILIYCYNILPVSQHVAYATICLNLMWWSGQNATKRIFHWIWIVCENSLLKWPKIYWTKPELYCYKHQYNVCGRNYYCFGDTYHYKKVIKTWLFMYLNFWTMKKWSCWKSKDMCVLQWIQSIAIMYWHSLLTCIKNMNWLLMTVVGLFHLHNYSTSRDPIRSPALSNT